jgi:hypothetical protein
MKLVSVATTMLLLNVTGACASSPRCDGEYSEKVAGDTSWNWSYKDGKAEVSGETIIYPVHREFLILAQESYSNTKQKRHDATPLACALKRALREPQTCHIPLVRIQSESISLYLQTKNRLPSRP